MPLFLMRKGVIDYYLLVMIDKEMVVT